MTDVVGNPEEERRAEFYFQPWAQEAVCRYFYSKVNSPCGILPIIKEVDIFAVKGRWAYLRLGHLSN